MSLFNKFLRKRAKTEDLTVNHMDSVAFRLTPEMELASMLLTSFMQDSYYRKADEGYNRMAELLPRVDALFAAKAAVYARTEFGMRSVSHALAAELAPHASGKDWAKRFYDRIVHRPDDMTEILALMLSKDGAKIPNALRKGFATAFGRFDGYQLAKYRAQSKSVKLVDVVNLVHPTPTGRNADALKALVADTLRNTETWEAKLSEAGQTGQTFGDKAEAKAEAWADLVKSRKIGYFALLRNLRNIIETAPDAVDDALAMLTNKQLLAKSLVLPFRFVAAYAEIEALTGTENFELVRTNAAKTLKAIERAATLAVDNLPSLGGQTVILSDNSGSMTGDSSAKSLTSRMSSVKTSDIANLFATMYWMKAQNTIVGLFGDRLIYPTLDRSKGLFDNFKLVDKAKDTCGGSTERGVFDMFERLISQKMMVDTIVIFSDTQIGDKCGWYDNKGSRGGQFMDLFAQYRAINPSARVYSVDLRGYGDTVFDGTVIKIAGWSEKIFDLMKKGETDKDALVNAILAVEL